MGKIMCCGRRMKVSMHCFWTASWCLLIALLSLTACSTSSDSGKVVFGTAAAGLPIQGSVYVRDAAGVTRGPYKIKPEGGFSLDVTGLAAPIFLKAEGAAGGSRVSLYSVALEPGMTNINPMTDLALTMAAGANHGQDVWDDPSKFKGNVTAISLSAALADIRNHIQPFLTAHGAEKADPFKDPIQLGSGLDAVFDRLSFSIQKTDGTVSVISRIDGTTLATTRISQIGSVSPIRVDNPSSLLTTASDYGLVWDSNTPMDFGVGLDAVSKDLKDTCVEGQPGQPKGNTQTNYKIEVIEAASQVTSDLEISASTSVKVGLYAYQGSARADYTQEVIQDGNSVYVLVSIDVIGSKVDLGNVKLKPEWADYTNYTSFRKACGDKYLSTITAGAKLSGILKITTTSDQEKSTITADIKGKYRSGFSGTNVHASFKESLQSLSDQYHASLEVLAVGPPLRSTPDDLAGFLSVIDSFYEDATKCSTDYTKCAYHVAFQDYPGSQSQTISKQITAMNTLVNYNNQYAPLLSDIAYILAQPTLFEPFDAAALKTTQSTIAKSGNKVLDAASDCSTDSSNCTVPDDLLDPTTVSLPKRNQVVPQKCSDYKSNFPNLTKNDEYRMYLGGDLAKPYWLYCDGMNTDTPKEYLTLKYYSPKSDTPSYNFASFVGSGGQRHTVYNKLRVSVFADHLTVARDDTSFASTTGGDMISYGEASTYWEHNDWDATHQGHANIDLTGLSFAVDDSVMWNRSGGGTEFSNWWPYDYQNQGRPNAGDKSVQIQNDRKKIDLWIAGVGGKIVPSGDLILKWVGH